MLVGLPGRPKFTEITRSPLVPRIESLRTGWMGLPDRANFRQIYQYCLSNDYGPAGFQVAHRTSMRTSVHMSNYAPTCMAMRMSVHIPLHTCTLMLCGRALDCPTKIYCQPASSGLLSPLRTGWDGELLRAATAHDHRQGNLFLSTCVQTRVTDIQLGMGQGTAG